MRAIRQLAIFVAVMLSAAPVSAQLIDRVLAVVGGVIITQSDALAALEFGLVRPPAPDQDPLRTTLDQLIPREIVLAEVNRSSPTEVSLPDVDRRMAAIRAKFASDAAFQAALARTAMTEARLRGFVSESLRIEAYEQERFGAVVEPSDGEIAEYYNRHRAEFTAGGQALTLDQATPAISQRLAAERRAVVIDEWVTRLRRRVDVTDVYFADAARIRK